MIVKQNISKVRGGGWQIYVNKQTIFSKQTNNILNEGQKSNWFIHKTYISSYIQRHIYIITM